MLVAEMTPGSDNIETENPYEAQRERNMARNAAVLATLDVSFVCSAFANRAVAGQLSKRTCDADPWAC